jgi:hypothetical protein
MSAKHMIGWRVVSIIYMYTMRHARAETAMTSRGIAVDVEEPWAHCIVLSRCLPSPSAINVISWISERSQH